MSLYPSLEDMKVNQMAQAQANVAAAARSTMSSIAYPEHPEGTAPPVNMAAVSTLYPSLNEYMGLDLNAEDMAVAVAPSNQVAQQQQPPSAYGSVVAPITGNSVGLRRAEIKQGVREVTLCKDAKGVIGMRVKSVNKGLFVAFVHKDSPAAMAGLRFGDQILSIDGDCVAGWDTDKAHKVFKNCPANNIKVAVRDRPFERTITLQKDSAGCIGFVFKDNKITSIVKDSSAARNGVLVDHHLLEVNGQNIVGMKEKEIREIVMASGRTVTITVIPSFLYEHIVKSMGDSLIRKKMDHSIPEI